MISPPRLGPVASAAFFTRFRNTWTSWSRLPVDRRQRGVVVLDEAACRGEAGFAPRLRTWSSTWWMLTGAALDRPARSANASIRSTSAHDAVGLVADQLRSARARSGRRRCSSSCAAPRMPDSGFFTSCASIAAIARRPSGRRRGAVSWRSILSRDRALAAAPARASPAASAAARTSIVTDAAPKPRAVERAGRARRRLPPAPHLLDERQQRAVGAHEIGERLAAQLAAR